MSYISALAILATPILFTLLILYYEKKLSHKYQVNKQKQKMLPSNVLLPTERVLANNFVSNGNTTLLKCTLNNQTFSKSYNIYRQNREFKSKKYFLFTAKFFFKLFKIFLIFLTYYLNFVSTAPSNKPSCNNINLIF